MLTQYDTSLDSEYQRAEEYRDALEAAGFTLCTRCSEPFTPPPVCGGLCPRCEAKTECVRCGEEFTSPYPGCVVCGECDRAEGQMAAHYAFMLRQWERALEKVEADNA